MTNQQQVQPCKRTIRQHRLSIGLRLACLLAAGLWTTTGCRNPYMPPSPYGMAPNWQPGMQPNLGAYAPPQMQSMTGPGSVFAQQQTAPQLVELQRRAQQLDENNRQLTSQLAQSQQATQALQERYNLVARQLNDLTTQNRQLLATAQQYANQAAGMQASMTSRGGAKLTANNSIPNTPLPSAASGFGSPNPFGSPSGGFTNAGNPGSFAGFSVAGANVIPDGNLIRVRMSSDQLFAPGSAQLNPSAATSLDQLAAVLVRQYPRQRVAIESHSDSGSTATNPFGNQVQLAGAQAQAIMDQLVRRNGLPMQQLFVVARGPNNPIADNQTAAGRAENRRIEVVIYPETF